MQHLIEGGPLSGPISLDHQVAVLRGCRWLILIVSLAAAAIGGVGAQLVEKQYSSTVVISTLPDSLSSAHGGDTTSIVGRLIGFSGNDTGPGRGERHPEALAFLQSESLLENYIRDNDLLPILQAARRNTADLARGAIYDKSPLTVWEASRYFREYVRMITTDFSTGLTRVTIMWGDPQLAAQWANGLVQMANERLRARTITESERRASFMTTEARDTDLLSVRESLAASIQIENQYSILAQGDREFALAVIDPATIAEDPAYPNTLIWVLMSGLCGALCTILWVFLRDAWRGCPPPRTVAGARAQLRVRTEPLFRPSTVSILGLLLSAGAWFFPDIGGLKRGYDQPAIFTIQSVVLLADWWLLIFIGLRVGEMVGERLEMRLIIKERIDALESKRLFVVFTVMTAIGLILTYSKILGSLSWVGALAFIAAGSGNALKASLYEQYSAGVLSLRYLVIFSASLAVYRFFNVKRWDFLYLVNFILLIMSALLSSRLMFVATVVGSLFLVLRKSSWLKIRPGRIVTGAFLAFFILAALNASRNSNYYAKDNLYFWGAGASSIISYLSAPFQSAIGAANHILEVSGTPPETYREYVDIDLTLNTNSSFVQNVEGFGIYAWPGITLLSLGAGFLFGSLQRYGRSAFLLPCAAILYASSELWRLDLFRQGIFFVWLGCGLIVPVFLAFVPRFRFFGRTAGVRNGR